MLSEKQQEQVTYLIFNYLSMSPILTSKVGRPKEGWSIDDLTSCAAWCGLTGNGIVLGPDHAENGGIAREFVVRNLACSWLQDRS